jgi:hypothetical protein
MSKRHLKQTLQSLHGELEQIKSGGTIDPGTVTILEDLTKNIQDVLENPGEAVVGHHYTLLENLKKSIEYFEVSHPKLAGSIHSIIASLNTMGI